MASNTRRERQRLINRAGILDAARSIAELGGWAAVTIRRIAEEIDYTSPIIYQHFGSKEAALQAVMDEGYTQLCGELRRAALAAAPQAQVLALGLAYLHFAETHPRLYELMTGLGGVPLDAQGRQAAAAGVIALTLETIQGWASQRGFQLADPLAAGELAWGSLHGLATLGMLPDIGFGRSRYLAQQALDALMHSWERPDQERYGQEKSSQEKYGQEVKP